MTGSAPSDDYVTVQLVPSPELRLLRRAHEQLLSSRTELGFVYLALAVSSACGVLFGPGGMAAALSGTTGFLAVAGWCHNYLTISDSRRFLNQLATETERARNRAHDLLTTEQDTP